MIRYEDWLKQQEADDNVVIEMANLSKNETGLPMVVWIEVKRSTRHQSPRMKFNNSRSNSMSPDRLVPISIDKVNPEILVDNVKLRITQRDLHLLKLWIGANYDNLMAVWNRKMTPIEFGKTIINAKCINE